MTQETAIRYLNIYTFFMGIPEKDESIIVTEDGKDWTFAEFKKIINPDNITP